MEARGFGKKVGLGAEGRLDAAFFKRLLRSDAQLYYSTPELNETLYLHFLGAQRIEGLAAFPELRVLYLEGNGLRRIEGLEELPRLRCLYLQENLIERVEGLGGLGELVSLNLADNLIAAVENLEGNLALETLQLRRNRVGANGIADLRGLLRCPRLASLDLAANRIDCDPEEFVALLAAMPALTALYLQPNPVCGKIAQYRKTLIARLKGLRYLDDRPVFAEDRRFAEAFQRGGAEAEQAERRNHREEERQAHLRNHLAFKAMLEGRATPDAEPPVEREEEGSEHSSQLETYITEGEDSRAREESGLSQEISAAQEEEVRSSTNLLDELD